jgi:hypothetical protein
MPTGLYDIRDRDEVLTPQEIQAGYEACVAKNIQYIGLIPGEPVMPVARYVQILKDRWDRCVKTAAMIDAIKAGYCSISPAGAPPSSDARH